MQTNYDQNPAIGFPGMRVDTGRHNEHVVSRVNPSVVIPFGRFVTKGTDDDHVKLPTTSAEVTKGEGFAIQDWSQESIANGADAAYPLKSAVSVLRQGRCWVKVEEAVTKGDDVFIRYATGTGTELGAARKTADTTTAVAIGSAKFGSSAGIGGLAIVEINLP